MYILQCGVDGRIEGVAKKLSEVHTVKEKRTKGKIKTKEIHKEIDLIQACIIRMADNCFKLKEIYISLISIALMIMLGQECDALIIGMFLLVVAVVFWGLDAFFLKMETLYRWKYEWIIKNRIAGNIDYLYDLNPHNKNMWLDMAEKNEHLLIFVFSKTLVPLYGTIMVISLILILVA